MAKHSRSLRFSTTAEHGEVSALLDRSDDCGALFVLGHGSGSNMHVPFIAGLSDALVEAGVATFRYEFPYSERPDFVPYSGIEMDGPEVLLATVRSAVAAAAAEAPDLALFAGGHSASGFMTSIADSESPFADLRGLAVLGFPLKGDVANAVHLAHSTHPMLFIHGTEDELTSVDEIEQAVKGIEPAATIQAVESAGHGFSVPGRPDQDVYDGLARVIAEWASTLT